MPDLSRRLLAAGCPWRPSVYGRDHRTGVLWTDDGLPDLTDDLTVHAALLALREATGDPYLHTQAIQFPGAWGWRLVGSAPTVIRVGRDPNGQVLIAADYPTEAAAIVAGWEAHHG